MTNETEGTGRLARPPEATREQFDLSAKLMAMAAFLRDNKIPSVAVNWSADSPVTLDADELDRCAAALAAPTGEPDDSEVGRRLPR